MYRVTRRGGDTSMAVRPLDRIARQLSAQGNGVFTRMSKTDHGHHLLCPYPYQNEPIWSKSEKIVAREACDAALGRELHDVMQEAKKMASQIAQPSDLWDLEHYLTQRRKEIDRKYDLRSSRLR
jgi:hypothetical protein